MGCASTKGKKPTARHRLSVLGDLGPDDPNAPTYVPADYDEGLLMQLTEADLMKILGKNEGADGAVGKTMSRVKSVHSQTDEAMNRVKSFSAKTIELKGEKFDPTTDAVGHACKKGLKPESPNQDSFLIFKVEGHFSLNGVFDGHGKKGHDVSNFVKDNLPKFILQQPNLETDPCAALTESFAKMQQLIIHASRVGQIDATRSGTTCSVILFDYRTNMMHIAHVGDSRCVLGTFKDEKWSSTDLTIDHKPDLPEERKRIEAAGGRVIHDGFFNYRVYGKNGKGGLNMSRAMGDLNSYYEAGLSCTPDTATHAVDGGTSPTADAGKVAAKEPPKEPTDDAMTAQGSTPSVSSVQITTADKFVLMCSDGVWETIESDEAVLIAGKHKPAKAMDAAEELAKTAYDRWIKKFQGQVVDDITALVINLIPHVASPTQADASLGA